MNNLSILIRSFIPTIMTARSLFVQNARSLEKLKTGVVPLEVYKNGRYIVFLKDSDRVLVDPSTKSIAWQTEDVLPTTLVDDDSPLKIVLDIVSQDPEVCLFAVDLSLENSEGDASGFVGGKFVDARKALFLLNDKESQLVSHARGLINFCRTTNFCRMCGKILETRPAGTQKTCTGCQRVHYPTLSPVGIVLIDDAVHSKVLLVRSARHPRGMYSCVAGFIEPGESMENSIRREIAEEVGLDVEKIQYCSSQHWAMPESQLMLGCIATATSEEFELDPIELDGGQWVDVATLADALNRAKFSSAADDPSLLWVPPPTAVAHTLMEYWLKKYHNIQSKINSRI